MAGESLVSPLNATERPAIPAKSTNHKKKETVDYHKAKDTSKSSKTKVKVLAEIGKGPSRS